MKKILPIILALFIVFLGWYLFHSILQPQRFDDQVNEREAAVIERVKDIRAAEQAFRQAYGAYTGSFDELIDFVLTDSLNFVKSVGSADDSVAVATGQFQQQLIRIPVIDTIFSPRKLTAEQVREMRVVPFSDNKEFMLAAGQVTTESGVVVPVFEAKAPYNFYLKGLNEQLLSNKIDEDITFGKYPGVKVGDLISATNDALNRE